MPQHLGHITPGFRDIGHGPDGRDGGLNGRKIIDLFLYEVKNHLNDGGIVQLIQSSLSDNEKTLNILYELGFIAEIVKKEHFFFEDITLINGYFIK